MEDKVLDFVNKELHLFIKAFYIGDYDNSKIYVVFPEKSYLQIIFIGVDKNENCFFLKNTCCSYMFEVKNKEIQALAKEVYK